MERRSFVEWVKCPIEFSKEFSYVIFNTRENEIYKYSGFNRMYRHDIILDFRKVYLNEKNQLEEGYLQNFHPNWYNNARKITEKEAIDFFVNQKIQNDKPAEEIKRSWFHKTII